MIFLNRDEKINFIYSHYKEKMLSFACRYLENTSFSEDVFQNSFFDIFKLIDKIDIDSEDSMPSIIFKIVKFRSIDINRKNKQNRFVGIDNCEWLLESHRGDIERTLTNCINKEIIMKEIKKMSVINQEIILYRLLLNMSFKEISQITNTREDCLRKRYERARKLLCEAIKDEVL